MPSFKGQYVVNLDDKARVAIPAKFRSKSSKKSKPQYVLTAGMEGCLALYPNSQWKKMESAIPETMGGLHFSSEDYRKFERYIYPKARDVEPDKQGRILIPSFLLKIAELEKEVLIIGVARRIELWNPTKYQKYLDNFEDSIGQVVERLHKEVNKK